METVLGCGLGLVAVWVALVIDMFRWMRLDRGDGVTWPIWWALTALYGVALYTLAFVEGWDHITQVGWLCWAVVVLAHGFWGVGLVYGERANLVFRVVGHILMGGLGGAAVWLTLTHLGAQPFPTSWSGMEQRLGWLVRLGTEPLEATQQMVLVVLMATVLALIHAPRWAPRWPRRLRLWGGVLSAFDVTATALAWACVVVGVARAVQGWWDPTTVPEGSVLALSGPLIMLGVGLFTAVVLAHAGARHWSAEELERLTLETMRQPWRARFTLERKPSVTLGIWYSPVPTTGVMTLAVACMGLTWSLPEVEWMMAFTVFGALLMPFVLMRSWRRRAPFGGVSLELGQRTKVEALSGVQWMDGRLFVETWRVRNAELLSSDARPPIQNRWWMSDHFVMDPEEIERIGFQQGEKVKSIFDNVLSPEDEQGGHEGDGGDESAHAEEEARRTWLLEIVYRGRSIVVECVDGDASQRLEAMADLWFLGAQIGCPIRQPHRLIADPQATHGQIPEALAGSYRAFAAATPNARERYADALRTWCHRDDDQGRAWWLIPQGQTVIGGVWWLVVVGILAVAELGWACLALPQEPKLALYVVLVRLMLLGGLAAATLRFWAERRAPNVYAISFGRDGIILQDTVIPWHEVVDLNLMPAVDFPLAIVTQGRLIGLPLQLATDAQLALAAEAGHALARHRTMEDWQP
ncbi:MAG: hypothetical protein AAFX99_05380 [Myxococcota bacterium]